MQNGGSTLHSWVSRRQARLVTLLLTWGGVMLRFKQMVARAASRWLIVAGLLGLLTSEAMAGSPTADRLPATLAPLLAKVLPAVVSIRVIGKRHVVTELKPGVEPPQPKAQPFKS